MTEAEVEDLMKVYTGTGDRGRTSLFSGERVSKDHERVEAYGDIDELNSFLGAVITSLPKGCDERRVELKKVQDDLFRVGACLASSDADPSVEAIRDFPAESTRFLEESIDTMNTELPSLARFILPGGDPAACWSHVARCICRRAERHTVRIVQKNPSEAEVYAGVLIYLNRLSDYLFVLARFCNKHTGTPETTWENT
jgi:cob(I)alamin adenosyltransferase